MNYEEVKNKALSILGYRSHSEYELRQKLSRAGAEEEDIERVTEFLKEYKFLNDGDYAKRLAHDLVKIKNFGMYRVRRELEQKGIDPYTIEDVVAELDDDEQERLLPLVEKKLGGDFERKNTDRTIRYFLYRGYSFDDIRQCIEYAKQNGD